MKLFCFLLALLVASGCATGPLPSTTNVRTNVRTTRAPVAPPAQAPAIAQVTIGQPPLFPSPTDTQAGLEAYLDLVTAHWDVMDEVARRYQEHWEIFPPSPWQAQRLPPPAQGGGMARRGGMARAVGNVAGAALTGGFGGVVAGATNHFLEYR